MSGRTIALLVVACTLLSAAIVSTVMVVVLASYGQGPDAVGWAVGGLAALLAAVLSFQMVGLSHDLDRDQASKEDAHHG